MGGARESGGGEGRAEVVDDCLPGQLVREGLVVGLEKLKGVGPLVADEVSSLRKSLAALQGHRESKNPSYGANKGERSLGINRGWRGEHRLVCLPGPNFPGLSRDELPRQILAVALAQRFTASATLPQPPASSAPPTFRYPLPAPSTPRNIESVPTVSLAPPHMTLSPRASRVFPIPVLLYLDKHRPELRDGGP